MAYVEEIMQQTITLQKYGCQSELYASEIT